MSGAGKGAIGPQIEAIVEQIKPILGGLHPGLQGAVLAELLAMWLAGHVAEVRESLLDVHVRTVRELIPPNAAILDEIARSHGIPR